MQPSNPQDLVELTDYWRRETDRANERVDQTCRAMQDHAYALGLARGRAEAAATAHERALNTLVVEASTAEEMRHAIGVRLADLGKPTAWKDGLCAT